MNQNDGKEEVEINKDGGNTMAMMTTVTATASRTSRVHEREERGEARRRTEDKQTRWQRRGRDERGWRQHDRDNNDSDGNYKPNIKRV